VLCLRWGKWGGWDTIEGPSEGGFSTMPGRFEVIFAQNFGDVCGRGKGFINPAGERERVSK